MSARDDLAEYLADFESGFGHTSTDAVEHIEQLLGWRPPARTIIDVEELDALPLWTVVRDRNDDVFERWNGDGGETDWVTVGGRDIDTPLFPATVLFEGAS